MPPGRHRASKRVLYFGPELDEALNAYAERTGETVSEIVRRAVATAIGRPDLAETVRMGRPKKGDEPQPAKKGGGRKEAKAVQKR